MIVWLDNKFSNVITSNNKFRVKIYILQKCNFWAIYSLLLFEHRHLFAILLKTIITLLSNPCIHLFWTRKNLLLYQIMYDEKKLFQAGWSFSGKFHTFISWTSHLKGCWVVFFIFIKLLIENLLSIQWRPWSDKTRRLILAWTVRLCSTKRKIGLLWVNSKQYNTIQIY